MNKKIYIAPRAQAYTIVTEGVVAQSLQIGTTAGNEQLTNTKDFEESDGWTSSEDYWKD